MTRRAAAAWLLLGSRGLALAQPPGRSAPVRFGILPMGSALESRNDWTPLLADLSRGIGRPVSVLSVTSYAALEQAIQRGEIDMAFLSGKMALDAVTQHGMTVIAKINEVPGFRAILITRKTGDFNSLRELLARPEQWRLARGEKISVTGFAVPQVELFLPNRIDMETRFRSEIVGTHQANALAVANGEADVATNNIADFERFGRQFSLEAARLHVIWRSDPHLMPSSQIVMRREYGPALLQKTRDFLVHYAEGNGDPGAERRHVAVLKALLSIDGFAPADDSLLIPAAKLYHQLARQSAINAQWVSEAAREKRLARIDAAFAEQLEALRGNAP
jgi:phosphonate transport system substrate-binding protein